MGDQDEATVKDRPVSGGPTVDIARRGAKITEPATAATSAFDPPADRFEQRGELGRGGMGRVDEAFDRALGRDVAIKHMLSHSDVDLARFEREARITARLEHPGIVPIHDAGRGADGTPYYVMRRVDGQPLSELVEGKPLVERLRLVPNILAACDAAAFAHARGIIHRDIKPTNILVGPFGETLLIDWGLARDMESRDVAAPSQPPSDPSLTRAGTVAGTPGFMSPEQARGETVDARADVFALGATLFYVLAGQLPWHGGSTEMIDHVGAGRPADWRLMPREVPPDLRAIVEKAMAADLAHRYVDATALAADLRQFTVGNLVAAYEYSFVARLGRFIRRHRAAVLVGGISLAVLAVVAVISIRRVIFERDDANTARTLAETRQREATAAADRLLVAHARELVEADPVAAIAVLRTLRPDSASWPEAWAAAASAWVKGIPYGFFGWPQAFVQISSDNRHAYIYAIGGRLVILDLVDRSRRELSVGGRIYSALWFDASHIVCSLQNEIVILDSTTGVSRMLPLPNATLYGNRKGRMYIKVDGRLLELTSADGEPHEVADDVEEVSTSETLDAVFVQRHGRRELWSRGHTYELPPLVGDRRKFGVYHVVRQDLVAEISYGSLMIHEVKDEKITSRRVALNPAAIMIEWAEGSLYAISPDTIERLDTNSLPVRGRFNNSFALQQGFVTGNADGSITLRDHLGFFHLGKRPSRYTQIDVSLDGKFLIAVTSGGEVLVWNLGEIRPTAVPLAHGEVPGTVTKNALWSIIPPEGVIRHDLATGAREIALESDTVVADFLVDPDEKWVAMYDVGSRELRLIEAGSNRVGVEHDIVAYGSGDHSLVYSTSDGDIIHWQPGTRKILQRLTPVVTAVATSGGLMLAVQGDRDLVRLSIATGTLERAPLPEPVDRILIDESRVSWIVTSSRHAYRWDPEAALPLRQDLPEPVNDIQRADGGVLFHGARSLILYEGKATTPHVISASSQQVTSLGDHLAGIVGPQGDASVIDLLTGMKVDLPLAHNSTYPLVGGPRTVGIVYWFANSGAALVGLTKLVVPRKPAELQQWLRDITNAKPVPNSEAVAWPD